MIRISIVLLFIFQTSGIWGQHHNDIIKERDFTEDGVADRLECMRELGVSCTFTDGSTKKSFEWGNFGWRGAIKSIITIPKVLLLEQNKIIYETMQEEILPDFKKSMDLSLQWIIQASFSKQKLVNDNFFEMILSPHSQWKDGTVKAPSNYYVQMSRDSLYHLDESSERFLA